MKFEESFASHPKSSQWSKKNKDTPKNIYLRSQSTKCWFDCETCKHEFEKTPYSIAEQNTWCSYCSNKKLCDKSDCKICFDKSFASHPKSKYWSLENILKPRQIFRNRNKEKFKFNCDKHEPFEMTANNVTGGKWCNKCGRESSTEKQRLSKEDVIQKCIEKHGKKYNYSELVYNGCDRNVTIICPDHGRFEQTPYNHYAQGNGCPDCAITSRANKRRFSLIDFITRANSVHNGIYIYDKVDYVDSQTNIIISCLLHGDFPQKPNDHLQGSGCTQCGIIRRSDLNRLSTEDFVKKSNEVHNYIYNYSETIYKSIKEKLIIICKIHGKFEQFPENHMRGHGCSTCAGRNITTSSCISDFQKFHGVLYDYSKFEEEGYINAIIDIPIICKDHGVFYQSRNSHLCGKGCPFCINKTEGKLKIWLESKNLIVTKQFRLDSCKFKRYLPFDFCIPDMKIIIELDGAQHFRQVRNWGSPEDAIKRDIFKMQKAEAEGYKIIRIFQEDVYNNDEKWLEENLLQEILSEDRTHIFISIIDTLYDEHISLYQKGEEIVLGDDNVEEE